MAQLCHVVSCPSIHKGFSVETRIYDPACDVIEIIQLFLTCFTDDMRNRRPIAIDTAFCLHKGNNCRFDTSSIDLVQTFMEVNEVVEIDVIVAWINII